MNTARLREWSAHTGGAAQDFVRMRAVRLGECQRGIAVKVKGGKAVAKMWQAELFLRRGGGGRMRGKSQGRLAICYGAHKAYPELGIS